MRLPHRFLGFILRFWPLWSVWLLILVLPISREILRLNLANPNLDYGPLNGRRTRLTWPWQEEKREFNAFRAAKIKPRDLDVRVWQWASMNLPRGNEYDYYPDYYSADRVIEYEDDGEYSRTYRPGDRLHQANLIVRDFPQEKWLIALLVRSFAYNMDGWADVVDKRPKPNFKPPPGLAPTPAKTLFSPRLANQLLAYVRQAEKVEPQNAFYPLVESQIWRRTLNQKAMWGAIKRASICTTYDNHNVDIIRCVFKAQNAIRPLLLEEKRAVWLDNYQLSLDSVMQDAIRSPMVHFGRVARKKGEHRTVIEIATMMARIGHLIQLGSIEDEQYYGSWWKDIAWSLAPGSNRRAKRPQRSRQFAQYAAAHGRSDVARMVPQWVALQDKYNLTRRPQDDAHWRAGWWRHADLVVLYNFGYVMAFWLVASIFLWWGRGVPSPTAARLWPTVIVLSLILAMVWWPIQVLGQTDFGRPTAAQTSKLMASATGAAFCFFGPPFLLALLCAFATLWRERKQFLRSTRMEIELQLHGADNLLLKSGATFLCIASLLASLGFWGLWLALALTEAGNFDPFAWLPGGSTGFWWGTSVPPEGMAVPLMYCLFLNGIGFILWFAKWRYFAGNENWLLTHSGLRRWKESVGIYLVLLSVVYLGASLCGWPSRAQANREIETRMKISSSLAP